MNKWMVILASALLAGCGKPETPTPPPAPTNTAPSFGHSAVDVITQRDKIQAGKQAKAAIDTATAKEEKDLEEVLNP